MPQEEPGTADRDDHLMARYARGDPDAFAELYRRYEAPLYAFCVRMLRGDEQAAEDAFQDAMIRVVNAREAYEGTGRFRSWLFTIARRCCIDGLRTRKVLSLDDAVPPSLPESWGPGVSDSVEIEDEVCRALAILAPDQREALLLSRYHGFRYREIAKITGTTEAAIKMKVFRALEALRECRIAAKS